MKTLHFIILPCLALTLILCAYMDGKIASQHKYDLLASKSDWLSVVQTEEEYRHGL